MRICPVEMPESIGVPDKCSIIALTDGYTGRFVFMLDDKEYPNSWVLFNLQVKKYVKRKVFNFHA